MLTESACAVSRSMLGRKGKEISLLKLHERYFGI
jgi:hypothetical protein